MILVELDLVEGDDLDRATDGFLVGPFSSAIAARLLLADLLPHGIKL
jgi:hypothetical protein